MHRKEMFASVTGQRRSDANMKDAPIKLRTEEYARDMVQK